MSESHIEPDDVETLEFDWGTLKWPCTPDTTDSETLSMGVVQLNPGKGHERHDHPDSGEILYIVSGEGTQTVADEEFAIGPDDTVYIPAGVEHSTTNTGWEQLRLIAVYAPAGPEDVLRDSPDSTILPPGEFPD